MRPLPLACLLSLSACAFGAPPGFSSGDTWTLPLVEPLSGGRLLTAVYVEDRGPYVFAIDPDAPLTTVDPEVVTRGEFRHRRGPRRVDEGDTSHPSYYVELTDLRAGDLNISLVQAAIGEAHAFDDDGRRIHGVLGKDVIADSLVFSFDRDRGVAWLTTQETFHAPATAQKLSYKKAWAREEVVPRRLVKANVDGHELDLHVDLGEAVSTLVPRHWDAAGLRSIQWNHTMIDEVGTHHDVDKLGIAERVAVSGIERTGVAFASYADKRYWWGQFDGSLGLDFVRPYIVSADWHHTTIYLTPRKPARDSIGERLARWNMPACAEPGCVKLGLEPAALSPPAEPRPTLGVTRDAASTGVLSVIVRATSPAGRVLPSLEVVLPPSARSLHAALDTMYVGATLEVVDASPFPRTCANPGGCVIALQTTPP
jgi:hypothetical protein